jgi:thiol-disulfide isomerase/thioredoxin
MKQRNGKVTTVKKIINACLAILIVGLPIRQVFPASSPEWIGKEAPEFARGEWINSSQLTLRGLHGKVVMVEFWTFGCSNCRNVLPHLKEWYAKYAGAQFELVGVHTPELERERNITFVRREVERLGITYPVVTDNDYRTWESYHQQYWPAIYLVDKHGIIRYIHIGEGDYGGTKQQIASLIAEE